MKKHSGSVPILSFAKEARSIVENAKTRIRSRPPLRFKRPSDHRGHSADQTIGAIPETCARDMLSFVAEDHYVRECIKKIEQDCLVGFDLILTPIVQVESETENSLTMGEIQVPSILNSPLAASQRREITRRAIRSLYTVGYIIFAMPMRPEKHALKELMQSSLEREHSAEIKKGKAGNKKKEDDDDSVDQPRLSGPMFERAHENVLPFHVLDADNGVLQAVLCQETMEVEWKFEPTSEIAHFYKKRGYRFEVFIPCGALASYAPKVRPNSSTANQNSTKSQPTLSSPLQALFPDYVDMLFHKIFYNQVVSYNASPLILMDTKFHAERPEDQTAADMARAVASDMQNSRGRLGTLRDIVPGKTVKTSRGYMAHLLRKQAASLMSAMKVGTTTNSTGFGASTRIDGNQNPIARKEPGPIDVITAEAKQLSETATDWLNRKLAATLNPVTKAADFFDDYSVDIPPELTVNEFVRAEYRGQDLKTVTEQYMFRVLTTFSVGSQIFGNLPYYNRATSVGGDGSGMAQAASATSSTSTTLAGKILDNESENYRLTIEKLQDELGIMWKWLYQQCILHLDGHAITDFFELELRYGNAQHDMIVEMLEAYEELHEMSDSMSPPPAKKRKLSEEVKSSEESPTDLSIETHLHLARAAELRMMAGRELQISYDAYARTTQMLFIFAVAIHGEAHLGVEFVAKEPGQKKKKKKNTSS